MPLASVLFISMQPASVGHVYRVTNHAERLRELGFRVLVLEPPGAAAAIAALPNLQAVIVFRPLDQALFHVWKENTSLRRIPLLVDVDDLTFDPQLLDRGDWAYWRHLDETSRQQWQQRFLVQRQLVLESDGAIVSTEPLAEAVQRLGRSAWVCQPISVKKCLCLKRFMAARQTSPDVASPTPPGCCWLPCRC